MSCSLTIAVPECGRGHSFFLWDRKQQSTEEEEEEGATKRKVRKAQLSPLKVKSKLQGLVIGQLQKCSKDWAQ